MDCLCLGVSQCKQSDEITTVIIENGERIAVPLSSPIFSLEIHLPKLVGVFSLKTLLRKRHRFFLVNKPVPFDNAIYRGKRNLDALFGQQRLKLDGSPASLLAKAYHTTLYPQGGQ